MLDEIILLLLSKKAHLAPVRATTCELAGELGTSQQSFSRRAISLQRQGYLSKGAGEYSLTQKAISDARRLHKSLSESLFGSSMLEFSGKIVRGFGQGKKFLSIQEYRRRFERTLGFIPYAGTLNVSIPPEQIELRLRLRSRKPATVEGFKRKGKTYGPILAYPALISQAIKGAVIFPDRSTHGLGIIELVAPVCIKEKLKKKDGDEISFRVECENC